MKFIFKLISLIVFLSLICIPVTIIFLCIDKTPLIDKNMDLTVDNINKVKHIINENRPKRLYLNQKKTLQLSENEINLLLSYGISHGLNTSSLFARAKTKNRSADVLFSITLPKQFSGRYINMTLTLEEKGDLIEFASCQIGQLTIPKTIIKPLILFLHQSLLKTKQYSDMWNHTKNIDQIKFNHQQLMVRYRLNYGTIEDIKETGRSLLLTDSHQQLLIRYYNHLARLTHTHKQKKNAVIDLTKDLISFADKNTKESGSPILENRTAIQVLSLYAVGTRLDQWVKKEYRNRIAPVTRTRMKFHNRTDLPKHFLVSAALTVSTGSKFANLIGLAKEVGDADGGSGFSFADLAADKAGIRFGELAITDSNSARAFQKKMSQLKNPEDIMPSISNLPEGISRVEFKATYEDLDSKIYQLINLEIESRINRCRFYSN